MKYDAHAGMTEGVKWGFKRRNPRPRSRLHLALLGSILATFFLISAAQASAASTLQVDLIGTGTGEVISEVPVEPAAGEPPIECSGPPESGTCENEFESLVTLEAIPDPGSEFVKWTVTGSGEAFGGCGEGETFCNIFDAAEGATTVTAEFAEEGEPTGSTLDVDLIGTGTGEVISEVPVEPAAGEPPIECSGPPESGTCENEFESLVTLEAIPDPGSEFVKWTVTGSGEAFGGCGEGETFCNIFDAAEGATTVTAEFAEEEGVVALSVTKEGSGVGTVTSDSPGIDCGSDCSEIYDEAESKEVTLTGTPNSGSKPIVWTGCDEIIAGNKCKVTMSAAKTVKAKFDLVTHTLTVNKAGAGSGSVTCNGGACAASYPHGTVLTLAASAASGSSFAGWSGGGCSGTGTCKVTLNADTTVTATFDVAGGGGGGGGGGSGGGGSDGGSGGGTTTPPPPTCTVPKVVNKSLAKAKSAIAAAKCAVGKITKPKGKKLGPLVVKSSTPKAGNVVAEGTKVDLRLGPKPKAKKHKKH